jgi:hypothetical protein
MRLIQTTNDDPFTAAPASMRMASAETEADHFGNCPVCGTLLDMRDLAQMLAHVHEQEIEIIEGDGEPAREGPVH